MSPKLQINNRAFIKYKFFNSLFFGIAIGSYVVQYEPLKIVDFPIMGIIFSLLAIPIAMLYTKIMTMNYFYKFSLFVEIIMVIWIIAFLISPSFLTTSRDSIIIFLVSRGLIISSIHNLAAAYRGSDCFSY